MNKKWDIKSTVNSSQLTINKITEILLKNRGLKTKKEIKEFLNPQLNNITTKSVGINQKELKRATDRIKKAIKNKETIVVFGDYDVDGICGTAILWETLYQFTKNVHPYIPHRIDEGYGLSVAGIKNLELGIKNAKLIITVDNGIVANEAVEFANKQGIDVIITDHHVVSKIKPKAYAIVHTTKLSGTGVAYLLAQEFKVKRSKLKIWDDEHLELVALATVADLVPLLGPNRTLLKFGLEKLQETKRVGLLELCKEAAVNPKEIGAYEIGHMIAPRLNAMGRLEYAMDALRLLCTKDTKRAQLLAEKLGSTNRQRQMLTQETVAHAKITVNNLQLTGNKKLLFISHKTYQQGVIGLVAGRLVEEYYRPAIVVSQGDVHSKASARSISGFNIIEFIRSASEFLVDAGGHPMAAGFTFETAKLPLLQKHFEDLAEKLLDDGALVRTLRIDCELPLDFVNQELFIAIQKFEPFGMANPMPCFVSRSVQITDIRLVGKDAKHLKLKIKPFGEAQGKHEKLKVELEGIAFGMGERSKEFKIGDFLDIVYCVEENLWNGNKSLQLKVKDVRQSLAPRL